MSLQIKNASDQTLTAELIQKNMREYYQERNIVWDQDKFENSWADYKNFEIWWSDIPVGIIRLTFENTQCFIREFQIKHEYQGKGLGSKILDWVLRKASENNYREIRLSVYTNNPARRLYLRKGYSVKETHQGMYRMSRKVPRLHEFPSHLY